MRCGSLLLNTENDKYAVSSGDPIRSATYCLIYRFGIACYEKKKEFAKSVTPAK